MAHQEPQGLRPVKQLAGRTRQIHQGIPGGIPACPGHAFLKEACSSFLLFGVRQGPPRVRRPPFFQRPARCFMAGHLEANIPEKEVFMTVLSVDKEMRLHGWG